TKNEEKELAPPSLSVCRDVFEEFGIPDVSDEICTRVLDVLYRHTCDIVEEAKAISNHVGHSTIEEADMKLAIELTSDSLMFAPPHREQLLLYAEKNSQPLPSIRTHHGLRLPTDRHNLTAPNYILTQSGTEIDSQVPTSVEGATSVHLSTPTTVTQSVLRLTATSHTNPANASTVRVIAPPGIGPSMIRIQSVQSMAQLPNLETTSSLRTVPLGSVTSASIQRRFPDVH
ncbi:Transcription initiation factor TFIID subunit 9, partial [Fasciola gigantica]